jgi:hypothetical protein
MANFQLVVTTPFEGYERGDVVPAAETDRVLEHWAAYVVRTAAPQGE